MITKIVHFISIIITFILLVNGCEENPFQSKVKRSQVSLTLDTFTPSSGLAKSSAGFGIDQVRVMVTAPDMDTIVQDLKLTDTTATGELSIEKGEARTFQVTATSESDTIFHGITTTHIKKLQETVNITLPDVSFRAEPASGTQPLEVSFYDESLSESEITAWTWEFGDGRTSAEKNPVITYTQPGEYDVTLQVKDADGRIQTKLVSSSVQVGEDVSPLVNFSVQTRGLLAHFTDQTLTPGAPLDSWVWDFGDGTTPETIQNPYHVYEQAGNYDVTLTVRTTANENEYSKTFPVYVVEKPKAEFTAKDAGGTLLVGNSTPQYTPLEVHFEDLSTDGSAAITSWTWDFGDGSSSTLQNPVHTYTTSGVYTVQLTVESQFGTDTKIVNEMIIVNAQGSNPPLVDFALQDIADSSNFAPHQVEFQNLTDLQGETLISYEWDFGDGHTSSEENPVYEYRAGGDFTVSLTVKTEGGISKTVKEKYITVFQPTGEVQLFPYGYDDGFPEEWYVAEEKSQMFLNLFTIDAYPVTLVEVQIAIAGEQIFELVVLDKETGSILLEEEHTAEAPYGAWHTYDINRIPLSGDFFVGVRYIAEKNEDGFYWPAMGFDTSNPEGHSYVYYPDTHWPVPVHEISDPGPGNWMIRVTVESDNAGVLKPQTLQYVPFRMTSPTGSVGR